MLQHIGPASKTNYSGAGGFLSLPQENGVGDWMATTAGIPIINQLVFCTAQGLQGLHGLFFGAQGLQGLQDFFTAHGLQGLQTFAAPQGLQGLQAFFAAQGLALNSF